MASKTHETAKKDLKTPEMHALNPFEEMERRFESLFPRMLHPTNWEWPGWSDLSTAVTGFMPKVDIIDRDKEILVKAELPGIEKDDLDVTVTDHNVTIKAMSKSEEKEEKGQYYRREIHSGEFRRTIALPDNVDETKAKATFTNGVLELVVPKLEVEHRRSIKVE